MHKLLFFFLSLGITAVSAQQKIPAKAPVKKSIQQVYYNEPFRPQFHFTPQKFWINDPNGLIYHNGEYHLFYQHNPFENKWGHMSWGHAVSGDLIRWKDLPVALREENDKMVFSGSIVQDTKNSSGFGAGKDQPAHVAIFTAHDSINQSQHLAYSIDNLRSFQRYSGNPVLDLHTRDFRDPNVFWFEKDKRWIMAVAMPNEKMVSIYSSYSLKKWSFESDFGPQADTSGVWECPDIFQVPVVGEPDQKKWVMFVSQNSSMQYFVGEFNGTRFFNENPYNKIFRPDYGPDYYAAITYKNTPDKIPVSIGWVNNWNYANEIPTKPWKGAMSLPREIAVKKMGNEWILVQQPVKALRSLRSTAEVLKQPITVQTNYKVPFSGQQFEMELEMKAAAPCVAGIKIAVGKKNYFSVSYDATLEQLTIDRTNTTSGFSKQYPYFAKKNAYLKAKNEKIKLRIFFDKSIIEIFANDGELVFTSQIFPEPGDTGISFFSDGNTATFDNVWFWKMKSNR
jgi:fructan beta-fructosidase